MKEAATGVHRVACLLLLSLFAPLAHSQAAADPAAWGIYAQLVGTKWNGASGPAEWDWDSNDTIVEKRFGVLNQNITRGAKAGELVGVFVRDFGSVTYDGRISPDGSVMWVRRGKDTTSMRIAIVDGRYREEMVNLDAAGQIAKIKSTRWYDPIAKPAASVVAVNVTDTTPGADSTVWGIYARLVGTTWNGTGEGVGGLAQWQWASDNTIVEKRQYFHDQIISRGANPGELVALYGTGIGQATYDGRIAADGSVLWIRRGFIKTPMRAAIVDGRYREELVKLDDAGKIVKIKSTGWYDQTSGQSTGAPIVVAASAPAAQAPGAHPAPVTAANPPASATVRSAAVEPSPPPASFRSFERYIGKHLFEDKQNSFLEFTRGPDNSLIVECHPLEGNSYWRYVVGESKKKPGQWEVLDTPGGPKFGRGAEWGSDGRLSIWAKDVDYPSWMLTYEFTVANDRVYVELFKKQFNVIGLANGNTHNESSEYREIGDAEIAKMRVQAEENRRLWAKMEAERPKKSDAEVYAERMAVLAELAKDTDSYEAEIYAERYNLPYTPPQREAPKPAAWFQALQDLNAAASASEARSRAALDATLQQAAQQAAYERQLAAEREQAAANARYADDARRAREATERQYEIARQFEAQQQAQRLAQQQREQETQRAAAMRPATSPPPRQASAAGGNDSSAANCSAVYKSGVASSTYSRTQADAERFARRDMELQCPGASYTSDAMQCSVSNQGDVVNIDSKGHATKVGENTAWICKANFRCTAPSNQCKTGPGKGSAQ